MIEVNDTVLADFASAVDPDPTKVKDALIAKGYDAADLLFGDPFPAQNKPVILTLNCVNPDYVMYAIDGDGVRVLTEFQGYRMDPEGEWFITHYVAA